ncbi:ABC transporter permease [Methanomassiliicoccus luminyensis]|uniref:ABC transporter permease n=1 Tax=Methanomassiliicoccus luminyensis TaxID=1080712 RepID=UPI00035D6A96|nr:ABC transporter permease [Methanomassiliicoccus luminyensis]
MTTVNATTEFAKSDAQAALPSDIKQVGIVAKYDILKFLRSRRLLGMLIIEGLVLALITALLLTTDRPSMTFDEVAYQYISFASTLVIIAATLFGGDAIVSEFQGRTGYLLFPNPVKRGTILAGKFLSACGAMVLVMGLYYVITLVAGLVISDTGGVSWLILYSGLLSVLYGVSALAVAFFISSLMKGSTGSLILTFALFFFVFNIAGSLLGALGGIKPWFIPTFAGETLSYIMQTPYPVDEIWTQTIEGFGDFTTYLFYPKIWESVGVMIAWTVIPLALAYFLFKRREMAA